MGTHDNGKVIPLFSPPSSPQRDGNAGQPQASDTMRDIALLRRRGLDTVDAVPTPRARAAEPASIAATPSQPQPIVAVAVVDSEQGGLNAPALSSLFIRSLDDMICRTPATQADVVIWPNRRDPQLDKVAVDIIDMLFGFVLEDLQVPRGVKESLLRAQMVVLQLSMREPSFFSDWQHPARKLLNDVAPMAKLYRERGGDEQNFEQEFTIGLNLVLDDLAPNGAAFAAFHQAIGNFASHAPARAGSTESVAWERAEAVAREYLERPLPHLALDFLAGYWVDVLQRTALLYPEDSPQWQDAVAVIEDLAWSLSPKAEQEDRLRLIGLIPALLARLNRGLDLLDVERSDRRPFFDALIEVHATVLRAELTPPPPPPKQETAGEQVSHLQRGDWVEFELTDGSNSRERLTWISPQRGILVFSNHAGQRAIQIAPEDLADLVQQGKATLIFDQPLAPSDKNSA